MDLDDARPRRTIKETPAFKPKSCEGYNMVRMDLLSPGLSLPLVIEAIEVHDEGTAPEALYRWFAENNDFIEKSLTRHGALLFRGFSITSQLAFQRLMNSISTSLLSYIDGNSPREKLTHGIYTSTEYPAQYAISLHNELSYSSAWPRRLFFCCITAASESGETPIADSRSILKRLDPAIVEEFTRKKIKYIRNLPDREGIGTSWQRTFETEDPKVVEHYCRQADIDFHWNEDGSLKVVQIGSAVATHPTTGEEVWFNQADQFHPSTLPKQVYESLMLVYDGREERFPQYACFGDDSVIDVSKLDQVRSTVEKLRVIFPWRSGDLLLIDNMLVCHGRMPYKGERKVLVSMI